MDQKADLKAYAAAPDMLAALQQARKWLGKMIADGGHLNSVAPQHAVRTLEDINAAIASATNHEGG